MKTKTRVLLLILLPIVLSLVTVAGLVWTQREVDRAALMKRHTDDLVRVVFALNQVITQDLLYQKERTKIQFRTLYASSQRSLDRLKAGDVGESFLIRKMLGNQEEMVTFPPGPGIGRATILRTGRSVGSGISRTGDRPAPCSIGKDRLRQC